jgi:hypothetical protein
MEHRWSGWPGAWCLDCGAEDERERCLSGIDDCNYDIFNDDPCPIHVNTDCPEPMSHNHDPYYHRAQERTNAATG